MAQLETPNPPHLSEEELVWFYYGEAENSAEIDLHLTLCRNCRADYESLKIAMKTIESWPAPERGAQYGEEVWRSLVRRDSQIASDRRPWWRRWLAPQRLIPAGALAALLAMAFLAGRVTHQMEQPEVAQDSQIVRERILAAALSEHLEASERTLVEITNREEGRTIDIRDEQRRARNLLDANRLYRIAAAREGQQALANVLEDLERVLLDVAHGPGELSRGQMDHLRARMEDEELLFKVRVLELRLRDMENQPVRMEPASNVKG